jgi:hypothetical protein
MLEKHRNPPYELWPPWQWLGEEEDKGPQLVQDRNGTDGEEGELRRESAINKGYLLLHTTSQKLR